MSEVHVVVAGNIRHDNPGVAPAVKGAGQPIVTTKDASGKTTATSGIVTGTGVIHNNPA